MALSAFDLYSVGIGPSSSHTVGPMRAARRFARRLDDEGLLSSVGRVRAELFGSLGATGHGHGSGKAVVLGLEDEDPATVDTDRADGRVAEVRFDYDIGAVQVRAASAKDLSAVDGVLAQWGLRPDGFDYPWATDDPR